MDIYQYKNKEDGISIEVLFFSLFLLNRVRVKNTFFYEKQQRFLVDLYFKEVTIMSNRQNRDTMIVGKTMKDAQIRALYKAGYDVSEIANLMGLHESTVQIIIRDLDVV